MTDSSTIAEKNLLSFSTIADIPVWHLIFGMLYSTSDEKRKKVKLTVFLEKKKELKRF